MELHPLEPATPVELQQHSSNPWTHKSINTNNKLKPNLLSGGHPKQTQNTTNNSSVSKGAHVVCNQLIPGTEPVPKDTQNSLTEKEVILSEGADTAVHFEESEGTSANEGAKPIAHMNDRPDPPAHKQTVSVPSTSKRRTSNHVFDATKPTVRAHSGQHTCTKKRKWAKPHSAFTRVCKRESKFDKHRNSLQVSLKIESAPYQRLAFLIWHTICTIYKNILTSLND